MVSRARLGLDVAFVFYFLDTNVKFADIIMVINWRYYTDAFTSNHTENIYHWLIERTAEEEAARKSGIDT